MEKYDIVILQGPPMHVISLFAMHFLNVLTPELSCYVIPRFGEKFQTFFIVGWKHAAKTDKNKKSGRSTRDISNPSTL